MTDYEVICHRDRRGDPWEYRIPGINGVDGTWRIASGLTDSTDLPAVRDVAINYIAEQTGLDPADITVEQRLQPNREIRPR